MKRQRRFYEVLSVIKAPLTANRFMLEQGWKNHAEIEGRYPAFKVDRQVFSSDELEFDVGYHPDLYDPVAKTVYEIKSVGYYHDQERYCLVQLSGYVHFLKAERGVFLLYNRLPRGPLTVIEEPMRALCPWPELKRIMVDSDRMLQVAPPC